MLLEGQPPAPTLKATRTRFGNAITTVSQDIARRALNDRVAFVLRDVLDDPRCAIEPACAPMRSLRHVRALVVEFEPGDPGHLLGLVYLDSQSDVPPLTYRDLKS